METYTITTDGLLLRENGGVVPLHGDLNFYMSNWKATHQGVMATKNGEDFESVEYVARFTDGKLTWIREVERDRKPAVALKEFWKMQKDRKVK